MGWKSAHACWLWKAAHARGISQWPYKPSRKGLYSPPSKQFLWLEALYIPEVLHPTRPLRAPDSEREGSAFVASLRACARSKDLCTGFQLHDDILRKGLLHECSDALVTMYAKCGAIGKAQQLFDMHKTRDPITWTALISGFCQSGRSHDALSYFERMQHQGLSPDEVTFTCVLTACGGTGASDKGERIHDEIAKRGLLRKNVILGNAVVNMYAKCGALAKARRVLEELPVRNAATWNALIAGYTQHGEGEQALHCFDCMQKEGLSPDAVTFICTLNACASIGAVDKGEQIHNQIAKQGLMRKNTALGNALVDMYAKCGALSKAYQVLKDLTVRNVVSWSALVAGYARHGRGEQALSCLEGMQREGLSPNAITFSCALKACGSIGALDKGEQIHDAIAKQGLLVDNVVLGTAVVDMYAKCGALTRAQQVLEELAVRNVVLWNALIAGYAQQGKGEEAMKCFERLQREGLSPDAATYSSVLSACGCIGLVDGAQLFFANMSTACGVMPDLGHYSCMVDVFGRAGYLEKAVGMVEKMPPSLSGVWYAILGACQKWGDVNVGRWAFQHALEVGKDNAGAHLIMANIYAAAGMRDNADERIEITR